MRLTLKADYALRALAELAARSDGGAVTAEELSIAQDIPLGFLTAILSQLRRGGIITSQRGPEGGYRFRRLPKDVTLADVIRVIEGPLAMIGDDRPGEVTYSGAAAPLTEVWVAVRANLRAVLERVTLADLVSGSLPRSVTKLAQNPDSWAPH